MTTSRSTKAAAPGSHSATPAVSQPDLYTAEISSKSLDRENARRLQEKIADPLTFAALKNIAIKKYRMRSHDAENLVQSVLEESWRTLSTYSASKSQPMTYLRMKLRSRFLDFLRKNQRKTTEESIHGRIGNVFEPAGKGTAGEDAGLRDLRNFRNDKLKLAINQLPDQQKAIVELRLNEVPLRYIAEALGCNLGTVKSAFARALNTLYEKLLPHSEAMEMAPTEEKKTARDKHLTKKGRAA